jgi:hypothetical protein
MASGATSLRLMLDTPAENGPAALWSLDMSAHMLGEMMTMDFSAGIQAAVRIWPFNRQKLLEARTTTGVTSRCIPRRWHRRAT